MADRRSKWDAPSSEAGASSSSGLDPAAAAAAAAAAKIAAQFKAPPSQGMTGRERSADSRERGYGDSEDARRGRDPHDADFIKDIEINDLRNRYMLTRAQTLASVHEETGASITAKGQWYPDKSLATPQSEPPLYLHISAVSQGILDKAVEKINEIINSEMPQLIEDRYAKRAEYEQQRRAGPPQRREWVDEKIPVGLDSLRNFNVRAKIVGPQGLFVKYIQHETGTRVQIKGLGSGFIDSLTGLEGQEPMYINVAGPDPEKLAEAKELAQDLLDAVKTEHEKARQAMMQQWGPQGGMAGGQGGYQQPGAGYGGYQGGYQQGGMGAQQPYYQQQQQQGGYGAGPPGSSAQQPPQPQGAAPPMPDDVPPPPPPEDDAPPPPEPTQQAKKKSPEEEALDKYWKDYIEWEKSFKAYHHRAPTKDEGLQDVPHEYR